MFDRFFSLFSHDIGIDLGTANTLVLIKDKGIVIREPSVVAMQRKTKKMLAIGSEAKKMIGKTPPSVLVIRPLKDGVISDFDAASAMLSYYIKKIHQTPSIFPKIPRPKVVIGIPSGVTEVERRAVQDACLSAGARKAYLIEEPMAAALGAGLSVEDPSGAMVVDIGGGTTEIAVISLGGIVLNRSIRIAGDEMDEAIINFMRLKYSLLLGEKTAEELKIQIGSARSAKKEEEKWAVIRGRNLESGMPLSLKVSASEIREAILPVANEIAEAVADLLEETPPELLADILEKGIAMAGGGSILRGIDLLIAERTKMPVWVAKDPMTCVVRGCGLVLSRKKLLEKIRITEGLR